MEDYRPNSHRFKEEQKAAEGQKKVEKVVQGVAKTKKKSEVRKFKDVFIASDIKNVGSSIFMDVLVPAAKKLLSDMVTKGVDMMLYGESGRRDSKHTSSVSYRKYYDERGGSRFDDEVRARPRFDFDEIVYETRGEAEMVRDQMDAMIERYGIVSVADMYDMAGLTQPYTSNKYGWSNIRSAEIVRVSDGYIIRLPKSKPLD